MGKELGKSSHLFTASRPSPQHHRGRAHGLSGRLRRLGVGFFSPDFVREEPPGGGLAQKAIDTRVSIMFSASRSEHSSNLSSSPSSRTIQPKRKHFYFWFGLAWASVDDFFWGITGSGAGAL